MSDRCEWVRVWAAFLTAEAEENLGLKIAARRRLNELALAASAEATRVEAAEGALAEAVEALETLFMVCLPPHDVSGTRMFDDARAALHSLRSYPAVQRSVERVNVLVEAASLAERHFARTNSSEANFMGDDGHEAWQALRAALRAWKESPIAAHDEEVNDALC